MVSLGVRAGAAVNTSSRADSWARSCAKKLELRWSQGINHSPCEGDYVDSDLMDATDKGGVLANNPELRVAMEESALLMAAIAKELPSIGVRPEMKQLLEGMPPTSPR